MTVRVLRTALLQTGKGACFHIRQVGPGRHQAVIVYLTGWLQRLKPSLTFIMQSAKRLLQHCLILLWDASRLFASGCPR